MLRHQLFRCLRLAALVYLGVLLMIAALQRSLIYFPLRATEATLVEEARTLGLEPWRAASGERIGWKSRPHGETQARQRLLVFHGNAGHALHRVAYLNAFQRLEDGRLWEVFLFEYPGYGARAGSPSEQSFIAAGEAALDTLYRIDERPVFLFGESIGSGTACALASREPSRVHGLLLWAPFASLAEVAAHHYPFLPVRLILRDRWDNRLALQRCHGPVGVRLAELDEVVTTAQGRKLYEAYAGPKRLWTVPDAGHNTISLDPTDPWWQEATDFILKSK